ncbi:hypothetical protein CGRA01v4_14022 [Colletotrichum graminicola]|uniref:Uncharacterized protein n=1 Tax=Colletotrichum graminicola (strain M1.001 / M2 / FGSC 10212) TaxID=645133 RepID=E3QYF6_COLGM|nr:uncharacterized protein GLRG_11085 [Colletotrichum graminicola M1.001]EFQ35894.1 hypothetical protein GLRG_11085 [Colletotrichum graminicola M1.001]WDK22732.1 hypothetical protein CGRA01v4_14022 [Colletotrichum graminicola]
MAPEQYVATHTSDPESSVVDVQLQTPDVTFAMAKPIAPGLDRPKRTPLSTSRPPRSAAATDGGIVNLEPKPERRCGKLGAKVWPCFVLGCRTTGTGIYSLRRVRKRVTVLKAGKADKEQQNSCKVDATKTRVDTK